MPAEGIWWHREANASIVFHTEDTEPEYRIEGPPLLCFTEFTISSSRQYAEKAWNYLYRQRMYVCIIYLKLVYNV